MALRLSGLRVAGIHIINIFTSSPAERSDAGVYLGLQVYGAATPNHVGKLYCCGG